MSGPSDNAARLAQELERLSELSISQLCAILELPLDVENGHVLRAKTTAAMVGLNTQLRADHLRLRAARADLALERLIELMREKQLLVPGDVKPERSAVISADSV